MPRPLVHCLLALAVLLLQGCGSDPSPGDAEPKRALDPRAEAIRFFPASTRAILLLRTDMPRPTRELARLASSFSGLSRVLADFRARMVQSSLDPAALLRLGRDGEPGSSGVELAAGVIEPRDYPRPLFVLPTERPEDLQRLMQEAVADGGIEPAGEFDAATLFRGDRCALGIRDGVLLVSENVANLKRAIETRDGEQAAQADDGEMLAAIDDLPKHVPLHAAVLRGDLRAGIAIDSAGEDAEIRISAQLPEDEDGSQGPQRVRIETAQLHRLLDEMTALPEPIPGILAEIDPLEGATYSDGDRFVASFTVVPHQPTTGPREALEAR